MSASLSVTPSLLSVSVILTHGLELRIFVYSGFLLTTDPARLYLRRVVNVQHLTSFCGALN